MTKPSAQSLTFNDLLTDFAISYGQDATKDFIADLAATLVRHSEQGGNYPVWDKGDYFRSEMKLRADGTKAAEAGFGVDLSNTFYAPVYAAKVKITDRQRAQAKSGLKLEQQKVRYLVGQSKLKRDKLFAAACFATGLWTSNTEQTGVSSGASTNQFLQFNDESSVPIKIIQDQQQVVHTSTGKEPKILVCNIKVRNALSRHPDLLDLHKHTEAGLLSDAQIAAALLGAGGKLLIGRAVENTAAEGASATMAQVFGNHALLLHTEPEMSDESPTAVAAYTWNEFDKVDAKGASIKQHRDEGIESDWLTAQQAIQFKITGNDLGVFFKNVVA